MSELIDAKLIVTKSQKDYSIQIEIGDKQLSFSKLKLKNDKFNGKECKIERIDGHITKIIVDDQTIFPEPKSQKQSHQSRQANSQQKRYQSQNRNQQYTACSQTHTKDKEDMQDSYKPENIKYIPSDTKTCIQALKDVDNFALKLNKAARFDEIDNKFKFYHRKTKQNPTPSYCIDPKDFGRFDFKQLNTKMTTIKIFLEAQGYNITEPITMTPDWRLIVGLGNESVYETSMTLHHIYGIPYIPGQAVKGVLRSYVITTLLGDGLPIEKFKSIENLLEMDEKTFEKTYQSDQAIPSYLGERSQENRYPHRLEITLENFKTIRKIFGNQHEQGKVIFFDTFPTEAPTIEPDVMTPHYGDYYKGEKPPADYLSLNPIHFLTVKGKPFAFYIGAKSKDHIDLEKVEGWLTHALQDHGIGAKTAVGYGYMEKQEENNTQQVQLEGSQTLS